MKKLCLILCLFLVTSTLISSAWQINREYLQNKVQKFTSMKNTGLIGGGLTLTIIGDKKSKKYRNQIEELTLVPIFRQNQAGVLLSFRF